MVIHMLMVICPHQLKAPFPTFNLSSSIMFDFEINGKKFGLLNTGHLHLQDDEVDAFLEECERRAAELELPLDYYLAEFT